MKKIFIVARREFMVRVRNRLFLVGTLLTPIVFSLLFVLPILSRNLGDKEQYTVQVIDPSGEIAPKLKNSEALTFVKATATLEALKEVSANNDGQAVLVLPADLDNRTLAATFYAKKNPSIQLEGTLNKEIQRVLKDIKLVKAGISPTELAKTEVDFDLKTAKLTTEGEKETSTALATIVGYVMAFMVYIMMLVYGQVVMQGVMEEKTNRIVEVIISSVKPIQLMIGKILGIGAVGLTQVLIWILLITGLLFGFIALAGPDVAQGAPKPSVEQMAQAERVASQIQEALSQFNVSIIFYFLFYFLGGYLIFGSLFGAVGSAIDQPQDAQQFTTVVMLPIIIPMVMLAPVLENPNSALAVWMSIIPYFSPTIMMVRLAATDVPAWQILISMSLVVGAVYFNGWLAGKIYRIGILSYGKKPTFKELGKWIFTKA